MSPADGKRRAWLSLRRQKDRVPLTLTLLMPVLCLVITASVVWFVWTPFELAGGTAPTGPDVPGPSDDALPPTVGGTADRDTPRPPNCTTVQRYEPAKNYCAWDRSLEECYRTFLPAFRHKPAWVFLGDYGMSQLVHFLSLRWPHPSIDVSTRRDPCRNIDYLNVPRRVPWTPPNASLGEGPIAYGRDNPYCTDSQKCWNVLVDVPTSDGTYVEFLVVEYARDVTLPSHVTATTQETVALYLSGKTPDVCVASAGLHDASIHDPKTGDYLPVDTFVHNVDVYITLLARTCRSVIWIGNQAVLEDELLDTDNDAVGYDTSARTVASTNGQSGTDNRRTTVPPNCRLQQFNNAAYGVIDLRGYDNVYVMDVWDKTVRTAHVDKLYLSQRYYSDLARLFATFMADADRAN